LSEELSLATGALTGVVVAWVAPAGPAAGQLAIGDVIEAVDGRPLESNRQWEVRAARLSAGDTLRLRVRRQAEVQELTMMAGQVEPPPSTPALGLGLRARRGVGSEVLRVDPGSAGARAGLQIGDVITLIGEQAAPTPAQVARAFSSMDEGQRALAGVTRGDVHYVTTLAR
jgi:S1-C subfamily serine protease